jgi:hypothetical protein
MRTIIVVQGKSEIGKTPAIVKVYELLMSGTLALPCKNLRKPLRFGKKDEDVLAVLKYNKKCIGINSMGDPDSDLLERLEGLAKKKCKVILTASRTSRSTVANIFDIAKDYKYEIIRTRHFYHEGGTEKMPNEVDLNKQFARGMADLILSLLQ